MTDPSRPSTTPRSFLALLTVALALLALTAFVISLRGPARPVPKDFGQYWVAGKLALRGRLDALYFADLKSGLTEENFPDSEFLRTAHEFGIPSTSYFIYAPWVAWAYAPLALLPPWPAYALACLLCALALALAYLLLARVAPAWGAEAALATFAVFCLSPPVQEAMSSAQASIPLFLLLVLFARALERRRDAETGAWWAVMTALKLFPLFLGVYLLARGRRRALAWGVAFGVAIALVSLLAGGVATNLRFVQTIREHAPYGTTYLSNQSFTGFALRALGRANPVEWVILAIPPAVAWEVRIAALVTLALVLLLIVRVAPRDHPWSGVLGLGLFATWNLLVAPHAWLHHLVALGLPATLAAARLLADPRSRLRSGALWTLGGLLLLAFHGFERVVGPAWATPPRVFVASLPLYAALVFGLLLALQIRDLRRDPTVARG